MSRNSDSPVAKQALLYIRGDNRAQEATMERLYLSITVTSAYALVTMLLFLAFMR